MCDHTYMYTVMINNVVTASRFLMVPDGHGGDYSAPTLTLILNPILQLPARSYFIDRCKLTLQTAGS